MDLKLLHQLTHRPENANKYNFGHVLVFGGSSGMVGAPLLSSMAALRIGAGLVTIASDKETVDKLERRVKEVMTLALPRYSEPSKSTDALLDFVSRRNVKVVVIGPGLTVEAATVVRSIVTQLSLPIVLDAGGLTAFYGRLPHLQEAARTNPNIIITPHTGEYAKLTGTDATKERAELTAQAVQFAKDDRLTLVLKGSHTIVCHPDRLFYENQTGNPGLATAGTGDVLTGMISGLLAQNVELGLAVETAVYLHGLAGDLAAAAKTQPGVIASDVIDFLPEALKKSQ